MKKLKVLVVLFVILVVIVILGGCSKILEYKASIYSYDWEKIGELHNPPSGFVLSSCQNMDKIDANEIEKEVQKEIDRIDDLDMSTDEGEEVINAYREDLNKSMEIIKKRADKLDFSFVGFVSGLTKEDSETMDKLDSEYGSKVEEFQVKYDEVMDEYSESLE